MVDYRYPRFTRMGTCFLIMAFAAIAPAGAEDVAPAPKGEEAAPEKILLRYKFRPDEKVRYSYFHKSEMKTHFNEATEIQKNSSEMRRSYQVAAVHDDGSAELRLSIDWVRMTASFGNGEEETEPVVFQSDDPTKHPPKFRHILDKVGPSRATIRFDSRGLPLDVKTAEPLTVTEKSSTAPGSDASPEMYLFVLPKQELAVGDSWKERLNLPARDRTGFPLQVTLQKKFTLTEVKEEVATIEFSTIVLNQIESPEVAAQLIQRELSGKILFDVNRGRIVSREVSLEKEIVGAFGPRSSLLASSVCRERILSDDDVAAAELPKEATETVKK